MTVDPEDLRSRFVAVSCLIADGTRAAGKLGPGSRVLYVAASDGTEVAVYDSVGRFYRLKRSELKLVSVYNENGKKCRFELDPGTGHLLVLAGTTYDDSEGTDVEEWLDCFPWLKDAPEARVDVQEAVRDRDGVRRESGMGPLTLEKTF